MVAVLKKASSRMKGWRTVLYNGPVSNTINAVLTVLLVTDFKVLGFSVQTEAWIILVLKVLDNIINIWLRAQTTTPIGEKY